MIGRVFWFGVCAIAVILNLESFVLWLKYIILAGVAIVVLGLAAAIGNAFLDGVDNKKAKKKPTKKRIRFPERDNEFENFN